jgi:hypothetical protein
MHPMTIVLRPLPARLLGAFACAGLLGACADTTAGAAEDGRVTMAVASQGASSAGASQSAAGTSRSVVNADGSITLTGANGDLLTITKVELVAREIRLGDDDGTCGSGGGGSGSGDDDGTPDQGSGDFPGSDTTGSRSDSTRAGCGFIRTAPVLIDLPLGAGAEQIVTADVPAGSYDRVRFKIHKPSDDAEDRAFVQANPDFADASIRVTGTFRSAASTAALGFTFYSDVSESFETRFRPALVVDGSTPTQFTIRVDVDGWFRRENDRSNFINPAFATLDGSFESEVKSNIKASFDAFEDRDRDGRSDDD